MQVITGKYRARRLISPDVSRPTLQRVKISLFSMIQNEIENKNILDLFAGSGALGIECISRGANFCDFVEIDNNAVKCLNVNLKNIDKNLYNIKNKDFKEALKDFANDGKKFDLIFLDPPYNSGAYKPAVEIIERYNLLNNGGLIVIESDIQNDLHFNLKECIILKTKQYSTLKITILKKE